MKKIRKRIAYLIFEGTVGKTLPPPTFLFFFFFKYKRKKSTRAQGVLKELLKLKNERTNTLGDIL